MFRINAVKNEVISTMVDLLYTIQDCYNPLYNCNYKR